MKVVQRLVAVLVLSSLGTSLSWGAEPQTSLLIRLPQETVKSGSNVEVDITIKNISGKAMQIAIPVGNVEREFELFVTDENGRSPAYTEWGVRIHGPKKYVGTVNSIVSGVLQPGQTVNEFFFVNLVYDLSRPGKYHIQIGQTESATSSVVKSNSITLTVTP